MPSPPLSPTGGYALAPGSFLPSASASASSAPAPGAGGTKTGSGLLQPLGPQWLQISHHHYLNTPKFGKGIVSIMRAGKKPGAKPQKELFLPNRKVSDNMREIILQIFKTKRVPDLSDITEEDREPLYKILALTDTPIEDEINKKQQARVQEYKKLLKKQSTDNSRKAGLKTANERLMLLMGSVQAGNRKNELIFKEGTQILNRLLMNGIITREQAVKFQKELV